MSDSHVTQTLREVEVVRIPSGEKVTLPAGTEVVITQALGGSYTLLVHSMAGLFRLDGSQADAIGRNTQTDADHAAQGSFEERVWTVLKSCYDPEIPVNIVDLGLIYDVQITDAENALKDVAVKMTLTAPGCGMGPVIAADAKNKIAALPGVRNADVALVWDPPWGPERITQAGREKLGMI